MLIDITRLGITEKARRKDYLFHDQPEHNFVAGTSLCDNVEYFSHFEKGTRVALRLVDIIVPDPPDGSPRAQKHYDEYVQDKKIMKKEE